MNRIKEVLDTNGISQTKLANSPCETFNMVSQSATNKVQLPMSVLYPMADLLETDARELLSNITL